MQKTNKIRIISAKKDSYICEICDSPSAKEIFKEIFIGQPFNAQLVSDRTSYDVLIVYHPIDEFFCGYRADNKDRPFPFAQDLFCKEKDRLLPVIHLVTTDVFLPDMYGGEKNELLMRSVPRYYRIMDSSIWNYMVPMFDYESPKYGKIQWRETLKDVIYRIYNNYKLGVYYLNIAYEYADFNARLTDNAFLKLWNRKGHGLAVSPFLFHSESKMYRLIQEKNSLIEIIKKYKWRILLVDDKIGKDNNYLSCYAEDVKPDRVQKQDIICSRLKELFGEDCVVADSDRDAKEKLPKAIIYVECAKNLKEAKEKLQKEKYELILLDYLFDDGREVEYGYELFEKIEAAGRKSKQENNLWHKPKNENKNKDEDEIKIGPHGQLYIMFISAFTTAVGERLMAEGLHRKTDNWYIMDGSCPTNTPYLFLFQVLHLMEKRLVEMSVYGLDKIYKKEDGLLTWSHIKRLIEKVFVRNPRNVRGSACRNFKDILQLWQDYTKLFDDVAYDDDNIFSTKESVLAKSVLDKNRELGAFLEHVVQLIYLTAFGTVRQWPEMWEEYQFVRQRLGPLPAVEKYIYQLKTNNI